MINGHAVNNFFVVKNGRFGAIHFEGSRNSEDDFCCTERSDLPIYDEIPKPVCDVPCEYDYFHSLHAVNRYFSTNKRMCIYMLTVKIPLFTLKKCI